MNTFELTKAEIGSRGAPAGTERIVIVGATALKDLEGMPVAAWEALFKAVQDQVHLILAEAGDDSGYIVQPINVGGHVEPYLTPGSDLKAPQKSVRASYYHACAAEGTTHFHEKLYRTKVDIEAAEVLRLVKFLIARNIGTHESRNGLTREGADLRWNGDQLSLS